MHRIFYVIGLVDLWLGFDDEFTGIAKTTDTPTIALFGFRNHAYLFPFRRGLFHKALKTGNCPLREICFEDNGYYKEHVLLNHGCSKELKYECGKYI